MKPSSIAMMMTPVQKIFAAVWAEHVATSRFVAQRMHSAVMGINALSEAVSKINACMTLCVAYPMANVTMENSVR